MRSVIMGALLIGALAVAGCGLLEPPKIRTVVEFDRSVYRFVVEDDTATVNFWGYNSIEFEEAFQEVQRLGVTKLKMNIRNPGGGVIDMVHIIEMLEDFKANGGTIHTHVSGWVASAAVPVMLMGDFRSMDENAFMMLHPHTGWNKIGKDYRYNTAFPDGSPSRDGLLKIYHAWNVVYCEIVAATTNMKYSSTSELSCMDIMEPVDWDSDSGMHFFTAFEALELGFVHSVV